jgi:hypothetical protein
MSGRPRSLRAAAAVAAGLALAAVGSSGCGAIQGFRSRLPPREPQPGTEAGEWAALRDDATRSRRLYDGFVHRADATATWLTGPVREGATRRLAQWQAWGPADLEKALEADRAEEAKGEEFLVAFYTATQRHNDLDARESIWRVEIDDGTTRVPAGSIAGVTADATITTLFPFVGPFDKVYRVRVPWTGAPLQGRPFVLRLAGALGKLELDFGTDGKAGDRPHVAP